MDLKRASTRVALAFGILIVIGAVARIVGPLLGPGSYVGRDMVILGPALALLGIVGTVISLLIGVVTRPAPLKPAAPPGWYTDPQDANLLRYFDGSTWTHRTAPRPPVP